MTTAAAIALSVAAMPVKAAPTQPVNIVFVHGAFTDDSSWAKVITILQAKDYNVTVVQNRLTSFADDVAATNRRYALLCFNFHIGRTNRVNCHVKQLDCSKTLPKPA